MFRKLIKGTFYFTTGMSTCYCFLRFVGSIGKCEDVSMKPALRNGDYVFISPLPVDYKKLQKGDVVFCRAPKVAGGVICKRLMAFEYDSVFNNEKNHEELVGRGHVWLEGDFQEFSIDSRSYGAVPYGLLFAKVMYRIWPLDRIGPVPWPDDSVDDKGKEKISSVKGDILPVEGDMLAGKEDNSDEQEDILTLQDLIDKKKGTSAVKEEATSS